MHCVAIFVHLGSGFSCQLCAFGLGRVGRVVFKWSTMCAQGAGAAKAIDGAGKNFTLAFNRCTKEWARTRPFCAVAWSCFSSK
jgi:hypothetical protein